MNCLMTGITVDDQQLLWTKKLLKESTNLSWLIDDCQMVLFLHLLASLLYWQSTFDLAEEFTDELGVCMMGAANVIGRSVARLS